MKRRHDIDLPFEGLADRDDQEALAELVSRLPATTPSPETRARTLRSIEEVTRLGLFAADVAGLLGIPVERADELLRAIDVEDRWSPGPLAPLELQHLPEDAVVPGTATGFLRLPAETPFPEHRHLGDELTYVLQGRLRDADGRVYGPGDVVRHEAGSTHAFLALPGPPLVYLFILREGMEVGGRTLRVDDPTL